MYSLSFLSALNERSLGFVRNRFGVGQLLQCV
jgi:hypothetical protein